jgi:hypothetical protein
VLLRGEVEEERWTAGDGMDGMGYREFQPWTARCRVILIQKL